MRSLFRENWKTLGLAAPIIAGNVSNMLMGLIDTAMVGRVGTDELAAVAFSNTVFNFGFALAIGLFAAVTVQISHAFGANRTQELQQSIRHGVLLSLCMGAVFCALLLGLRGHLHWFQQPEAVTAISGSYLGWLAWSFVPLIPMLTLKSVSEALNRPWPIFGLLFGTVLVNGVLNYVLIFGHWGFPAMGLDGAGCATFIARLLGLVLVVGFMFRSNQFVPNLPVKWLAPVDVSRAVSLLKMAVPISIQVSFEFGVFAVCALLIGQFGSVALAAHQVAFTFTTTAFMLPLGLSMALTIRVAHVLGSGEIDRCKRMISGAVMTSVCLMGISAMCCFLFGEQIARLFTVDEDVVTIAASFLMVTGIFQLFDGIQVTSMAALRGMRDINIPTVLNFITFFLIGIPVGILLAFHFEFGAIGLWWGLAFGLCASACVLGMRLIGRMRRVATEAVELAG